MTQRIPGCLKDSVIRASWEAERHSMRKWLLKEKKFNPNAVEKFIDNYIDSMVFAKLPCGSEAGIKAAWTEFKMQ